MPESTRLREETLPGAVGEGEEKFLGRVWEKTKLVFARSVFWSYERGTWQYDLIVLVILAFIFSIPRPWFRDRPTLQLTDLRHNQGVVEVSRDKDGRRYVIDARLVESLAPMKPDDAIREILQRRLRKPVTVKSTREDRDKNNVLLGYTVVVAP